MADLIQERDQQTGIEQAWHGKTIIPESGIITRENCGIIYGMELRPLFVQKADGSLVETEHKQIVSLDDELPIGKAVSSGYGILGNETIWDMVADALVGMSHQIISAGTVEDRSKGFITIKMQEEFMAASRKTEPYFNIIWGHGGNISLIARSGFTVVVCSNTFAMALGKKGKDMSLSLKHTKNALLKIENMGKAIENHIGVAAEFRHAMDSFEAVSCDEENARKVFSGVLAPDTFERELKVSTRLTNQVDRLAQLFNGGAGNSGRNLADVFNAATDYYSHESSGGNDRMKQFVSSEFGAGQRNKDAFFSVLSDADLLSTTKARGEKVMLAMAMD